VVPRSQEKYAVGQKKMDDTYLLLLQRMMPWVGKVKRVEEGKGKPVSKKELTGKWKWDRKRLHKRNGILHRGTGVISIRKHTDTITMQELMPPAPGTDPSQAHLLSTLKGTVARDFRPPLFSIKRTYLGPWFIS
jgi:hypothetical protein